MAAPRVRTTSAPTTASGKPLQARAEKTRQALLEATYACLVEHGVAGTTTTTIVKRAGVSQGALFKHFESKHAILAAATAEIFSAMVTESQALLAKRQREREGSALEVGANVLVDLAHTDRLQVCLALYAASRTDPHLQEALKPAFAAQQANVRRSIRASLQGELSAAALHSQAFSDFLDGLLLLMHGIASQAPLKPDEKGARRFLDVLVQNAQAAFEAMGTADENV